LIGFASCSLFFSRGRVSPRQATYFSLLRQRKVGKRKATLLSATLRCATGNLRCSRFAGSRRTRFAQTAASPDPRTAALLGAARRALGTDRPSLRSASSRAFASLGRGAPTPAFPREGREKDKTCDTGPDALLLPLPGEGWDGGTTALATAHPSSPPGRAGGQERRAMPNAPSECHMHQNKGIHGQAGSIPTRALVLPGCSRCVQSRSDSPNGETR
jgi:hypothetical protein